MGSSFRPMWCRNTYRSGRMTKQFVFVCFKTFAYRDSNKVEAKGGDPLQLVWFAFVVLEEIAGLNITRIGYLSLCEALSQAHFRSSF